MRATTENGRIWLNDEAIISVEEGKNGVIIELKDHNILVKEDFNDIICQIDPILEGDTVEEVAANLLKSAVQTPFSLLKRIGL